VGAIGPANQPQHLAGFGVPLGVFFGEDPTSVDVYLEDAA